MASMDFTMAPAFGSLERALDVATDPARDTSQQDVEAFVAAVNNEKDGPRDAIYMVLDKIRHKNTRVAVKALNLLEACVNHCGSETHAVIGKFRFLNELIKLVSPKYGDTPEAVRVRILDIIQRWAVRFPQMTKIREVRDMLKNQGVTFPEMREDPASQRAARRDSDDDVPPPRESPLETDPKKSKLLQKLLKSKDPNDLMKANKLIKRMVKEDAKRQTRAAQLRNDLDTIQTKTKLLSEMLSRFDPSEGRLENNEVIQELLQDCQDTRPRLIKLVSELDEKDTTLGDVLSANDDITRVLDQYSTMLAAQPPAPQGGQPASSSSNAGNGLGIDLMDFGPSSSSSAQQVTGNNASALDDFASLRSPTSATETAPTSASSDDLLGDFFSGSGSASAAQQQQAQSAAPNTDFLSSLGQPSGSAPVTTSSAPVNTSSSSGGVDDLLGGLAGLSTAPQDQSGPPPELSTINVELSSIKPSSFPPSTIYDKNNFKVVLHYAENSPHPRIKVAVASFLNLNHTPINNIVFQAAVPKAIQVKLQAASAPSCPALPMTGSPTAVTQVMLFSNPTQASLRLRFRLQYEFNGQQVTDMGEFSNFPFA